MSDSGDGGEHDRDGFGGDDPVDDDAPRFPAYGPVEAVLGYVLFYVLVDRVTPTVLEVAMDLAPGLDPSTVGLGLASILWVVLALNVLEQGRRQLAALGVLEREPPMLHSWSPLTGVKGRLAAVALVVLGSVVAVLSYDAAVAFLVSLLELGTSSGVSTVSPYDALLMVVFFVGYGVAAHALDRLVVDIVRRR